MSAPNNNNPQQSQAYKATFAPKFDEMIDALESLYIAGNQSGRLNFRQAWPLLAPRVFPPELMAFDEKGVTDRARRAELEKEAEEKRTALIAELLNIRDSSIRNSMLELDFIKGLIQKQGREFAALIYAETLLEKFAPSPNAPERAATPVAEKPVAATMPEPVKADQLEEVAPIAVAPPPPPLTQQKRTVNLTATFNSLAARPA